MSSSLAPHRMELDQPSNVLVGMVRILGTPNE